MVLVELLVTIVAIVVSVVLYIKWSFTYWERKGLPYIEPSIPFGNMENPLIRKHTLGDWMKKLYDQFKIRDVKHGGLYFFSKTSYMPIDPNYIKNIMQRDFQYFVDRGFYHNEADDPLSAHLFAIGGPKWRNLRTKLTPTFTSGKMKMMFSILMKCSLQMQDAVDELCKQRQPVDIKEILACFTTDVIGSCAFGLECNSFATPDAEFRKYGKKIFDPLTGLKTIRNSFAFTRPALAKKLHITLTPKDASDFFLKVISDTLKFRKTNNFTRNDMLQILIDLKDQITFEEIAAQAFVFFIAGFETSSTTMTFCLYELAKNPEIQGKVRKELNDVLKKHNGELSYEAVMDLKYLGQVIDETLRKYPPIPFLTRDCGMDYQIPDTNIVIEKGTRVVIPVLGLHRDPEYYPDPDKFEPERFNEENRKSIVPFSYIPFGEGPRLCIGMRFGIMQTKIGLATLLRNFAFSVNKKTIEPIEWDPFTFILTSEKGIWLDIEKLFI